MGLTGIIMILVDLIPLIFFLIATIMCFRLVKKLYGGRFTSALPYLLIGIFLILGMQTIHLMEGFFSILEESMPFMMGIQMLQLVAGIFFIKALYEIYQSRFATEGFLGFEEKTKLGGKKQ